MVVDTRRGACVDRLFIGRADRKLRSSYDVFLTCFVDGPRMVFIEIVRLRYEQSHAGYVFLGCTREMVKLSW